ncbi:hypothetical protein LOK49_Contig310G00001 [Camellia lanceoleosa]|nr:hypothetical protein LOK49_Contig310G00001 [Camellia lanceoleosa]
MVYSLFKTHTLTLRWPICVCARVCVRERERETEPRLTGAWDSLSSGDAVMLCTSSVPGSTFSVLHYPCLQSSVRSCNGHHCQNQQRLPLGKPSSVLRFYTSGGLLHHHECNVSFLLTQNPQETELLRWIKHHYFAMAMALISLTWETQKQRGVQLFLQWAIMQGVAMLLQNRYQRQRLCTHIALGKARRMDVVWGETAGVDSQLWLSAPILFILQDVLFQVHWLTAMLTNFLFSMARDSIFINAADSDAVSIEWEVEGDDESEEESECGLTTLVDMPLNSFPSTVSKETFELKI